MNATSDFSLCIRRPESCSRHADCARAQLGSRNPQRQAFVAPPLTGDACSLFYDFAPFRQIAENGGGIADNTFGAARSARAVGQQPPSTATNATPSPAPALSSSAQSRVCAGVCTTGGGEPSRAAGQSFAGVGSSPAIGATAGSGYGVLGAGNLDSYEREQLAAARIISPPPAVPIGALLNATPVLAT